MSWARANPDEAFEWFKLNDNMNQEHDGGVGYQSKEVEFINALADRFPDKLLTWSKDTRDDEREKHILRALGTNRYDLALKLAATENDPEKRFLMAVEATKRRSLYSSIPEVVPVLSDLPLIGRLFLDFNAERAKKLIEYARSSSLDEHDQQRVIKWIEERSQDQERDNDRVSSDFIMPLPQK